MALPPCFRLADEVFPRVRAGVARRLVADGWSQGRAAQALGVSQATVSKMVGSRPPRPDPLADRLADELYADLAGERTPGPLPSAWCGTLAAHQDPGARAALDDLLGAERLLQHGALPLVPQIGLNVAVALPGARDPAAILSFPGRMVDAGGRLVAPAPPAWGASQHLASGLLALLRHGPERRAMANVRGGPDVAKACRRLGWEVAPVPPGAGEDAFPRAVAAAPQAAAWHHPGDVGLEPCLYVAGPDATGAARRILELSQALR